MCGIFAIFNSTLSPKEVRRALIDSSSKLRHRGPDWSGYHTFIDNSGGIAHERLSIVDPESGKQPFIHKFADGHEITCAANGELYNYQEIYAEINDGATPFYTPQTGSDCEVLLACYLKYGKNFGHKLNGMYAFAIHDSRDNSFVIGRDHLGIAPLYIAYGTDGSIWVGSEMKSVWERHSEYEEFPPGHLFNSDTLAFEQWYNPVSLSKEVALPTNKVDYEGIRAELKKCIKRCVVPNAPWGVLLSGGLDSSIVASVAVRLIKEMGLPLKDFHAFSIGLAGSPDTIAAKKVAKYLGIAHHDFSFTIQEGTDAITEVISKIETYDPANVRAAIPMFLLMRKIKSLNFKVILGGDGADELFGGYLYMNKAPTVEEFHHECIDKLLSLHNTELLRGNIVSHSWGVECRVPYLDPEFIDYAMLIDPSMKRPIAGERIEKHVLRKAYDTPEDPYLPQEILWRQKEQFSDGVGYAWVEALKAVAEKAVSARQLEHAHIRYRYNTPMNKEAYHYRTIFGELYPKNASAYAVAPLGCTACSTKRAFAWDPIFAQSSDISGRAMTDIHNKAYGSDEISPAEKVAHTCSQGHTNCVEEHVVRSPLKRGFSAAFA